MSDDKEFDNQVDEDDDESEGEEDDEEEDDEDDEQPDEEFEDDFDDVEPPPEAEVEVDPRGQPAEYYQADYGNEDERDGLTFQDEHHKAPEEEESRRKRLLALLLCCCCCLIIVGVGVVLALLLSGGDDEGGKSSNNGPDPTPAPVSPPTRAPIPLPPSARPPPTMFPTGTPRPSPAPSESNPTPKPTPFPTSVPTLSASPTKAIPDELVFVPSADTYMVDGFDINEAKGDLDSFLVQNGPEGKQETPDAFALLNFDVSTIPFAKMEGVAVGNAVLEMVHQPNERERDFATYTIERLTSTVLSFEKLSLQSFGRPVNGIMGQTFDVAPNATSVSVDVTDLLFGGVYEPVDDSDLFLMISNYGEVQNDGGDRFESRETGDNAPKLRITFEEFVGGTPSPTGNSTV